MKKFNFNVQVKSYLIKRELKENFNPYSTVGNWYLSADFQIYVLVVQIVFYLVTKPKLGFSIAFGSFCLFTLFNIVYNVKHAMPAFFNTLDFDM